MSKYDWSNIPPEVNWIATDSDGDVFGYLEKPEIGVYMWFGSKSELLDLKPFPTHWKESLEERPK